MLRRGLGVGRVALRMASGSGGSGGGKLAAAGITKDPKTLTDDEWRKVLSPEEFDVARKAGTEAPGTGKFDRFMKPGEYTCICCGTKLFVSETKFDSGCGWPAFWAAESESAVRRISDESHGMVRVEVRCNSCDAHLGHVFEDGPPKHGGERFCINSASLHFQPKK